MAKTETIMNPGVPRTENAFATNLGTGGSINTSYVSDIGGTITEINGLVIVSLILTMKAVALPLRTTFIQLGTEYRPASAKNGVFICNILDGTNTIGSLQMNSSGEIYQTHNTSLPASGTWFMNVLMIYTL